MSALPAMFAFYGLSDQAAAQGVLDPAAVFCCMAHCHALKMEFIDPDRVAAYHAEARRVLRH